MIPTQNVTNNPTFTLRLICIRKMLGKGIVKTTTSVTIFTTELQRHQALTSMQRPGTSVSHALRYGIHNTPAGTILPIAFIPMKQQAAQHATLETGSVKTRKYVASIADFGNATAGKYVSEMAIRKFVHARRVPAVTKAVLKRAL